MGFDGEVNALALQPDGKIIVGGGFSSYNGKGNACNKIARLNSDGSFDKSFTSVANLRGTVYALSLLPDGKILAGGMQHGICGLIRLNSDGTLDNSFNNFQGVDGDVFCIAQLPGGKIIAGGKFLRVNKQYSAGIVKLNSDGTVDNGFVVGSFIKGTVMAIAQLNNGKLIIAGNITGYDKTISWNIMRLNSDGTFDNSFIAPAKPQKSYSGFGIFSILPQKDGKIILGGRFTEYNSIPCKNILRINADGSFDNTFQAGAGADVRSTGIAAIHALALRKDGSLIVAGNFDKFDETLRSNIASVSINGRIDHLFNTSNGFDKPVTALAIQKDRKIVAVGEFKTYNGVTRIGLARLHPDGSIDNSWNITSKGFNKEAIVNTVALQGDGKIIAGGRFESYAEISRRCITRLNADGTIDNSFYSGTGFNNQVRQLALQPDGKIIVIGDFSLYDGNNCNNIARLNADGNFDNSFQVGEGFRGYVSSMAVQRDGKIIINGRFMEYNKIPVKNLVRLNPDGSIDNSFSPAKEMRPESGSIQLQPDGKIVIAGKFGLLGTIKGTRVVRLHTDGKTDTSFNWLTTYSGLNDEISIALQADGKIIVYGGFTHINDNRAVVEKIIRLNSNGSIDNCFIPIESFPAGAPAALVIQEDGKLLAAGNFKTYNKYFLPNIVRIEGK